ncbi:MAG TPA: antibiotic biosynthesis monooxygenase family protein [Candidatus Bathyarchaeia archaeon]|nr:antibiotic biosynthesis monooxygenase family protein [Candidatus Bathyarchaeia archaeon]
MIVEYIRYAIPEDQAIRFAQAWEEAGKILQSSSHCLSYEISQCSEDKKQFTVRIEWDSLDGHLKGFRTGPGFRGFFGAVQPFYTMIEEMHHYTPSSSFTKPQKSR